MASPVAQHIPDEILSEILTPLLKHPDEVFSDTSKKALLEPGYSSSTYLLVCKAWLRVSTPLLYHVVILRTTAQAETLQTVLKSNKEFGLRIKKLRVEGGFGNAMHSILKSAPNITDLFLTLDIWATDSVRGLCSGLPLISPRRVIVVDAVKQKQKPKKNKQVTELLETLVALIPKWDKMETFDFPYIAPSGMDRDLTLYRAEALASALGQSQSLQTLFVRGGYTFPDYLRQVVNVPSLQSLYFILGPASWDDAIRTVVRNDPKLEAVVKYTGLDMTPSNLQILSAVTSSSQASLLFLPSLSAPQPLPSENSKHANINGLLELTRVGEIRGATLEDLNVFLSAMVYQGSQKTHDLLDPIVLTPFTSLMRLTWTAYNPTRTSKVLFSAPRPGFSALPNVQLLRILGDSPSVLDIGLQLPLECLQEIELNRLADVPASTAFLQCHGAKLLQLTAPLEILIKIDVFNLCTSLNTVVVVSPFRKAPPEAKVLPENFITCSTPHTALAKIHFDFYTLDRGHEPAIKQIFEQLKSESFPVLKEIQMRCIKWPTSEREVGKNKWIPLSEVLRPKGIKLTDLNGVGGTGTGRVL